MIKKKEQAASVTAQVEVNPDDEAYVAEVLEVYGKSGAGGDLTFCKVLLKDDAKVLMRTVFGPVRVGDMLLLREKVRQSKRYR